LDEKIDSHSVTGYCPKLKILDLDVAAFLATFFQTLDTIADAGIESHVNGQHHIEGRYTSLTLLLA
jgi:hypothetical protein